MFSYADANYPEKSGSDTKTDMRNRFRTPENPRVETFSMTGHLEPCVPKKCEYYRDLCDQTGGILLQHCSI